MMAEPFGSAITLSGSHVGVEWRGARHRASIGNSRLAVVVRKTPRKSLAKSAELLYCLASSGQVELMVGSWRRNGSF